MMLFKYTSLAMYKQCLLYIEGDSLLNFSIFANNKLKLKPGMLLVQLHSSIFIYKSIFYNFKLFNFLFKSFFHLLQTFFFRTSIGYYHGFRLIGRGYKVYLHLNNFVFRLGYSHNVYYMLPTSFKTQFKEKLKHFWIIRGLDYTKLSIVINKIRSFRIPNTYRHKGIYRMDDSYKIKATKKGAL